VRLEDPNWELLGIRDLAAAGGLRGDPLTDEGYNRYLSCRLEVCKGARAQS
jgi:hypothetical protein